jgi:hypothetical protein
MQKPGHPWALIDGTILLLGIWRSEGDGYD